MNIVGVSVTFFCAALNDLEKQHGPRDVEIGKIEELRSALERAEVAYKALPTCENKDQAC